MKKLPDVTWGWLVWLIFGGVFYYLGSIDIHFSRIGLFPIVFCGISFLLVIAFWWLGDR